MTLYVYKINKKEAQKPTTSLSVPAAYKRSVYNRLGYQLSSIV